MYYEGMICSVKYILCITNICGKLSCLYILQLFVRGGYIATLYDISDDQLQGALVAIGKQLQQLEGEGLLREGQKADELVKHVSVTSDLKEAMQGTEYVQVYMSVLTANT